MKRVWIIIMALACAQGAAVYGGPDDAPALRTWTSQSGSTVDAEYIGLDRRGVKLRTAVGDVVVIGKELLSAEDQSWIDEEEARRNTPAGVRPPSEPDELPVFDQGKGKGHYAVVNKANYDAFMDNNGVILVRPKVNGVHEGRPLTLYLDCYYRKGGEKYQSAGVVAFQDYQDPAMQPSAIKLSGLLKRDVPFHVTYEFHDRGINVRGNCEDSPETKDPTIYRVRVKVPRSHDYEEFPTPDDQVAALTGWSVLLDPMGGGKKTFTYLEPISFMGGKNREVMIDAPLFGSRRISFKTGTQKIEYLQPVIYKGKRLWEGFSVVCTKDENDLKPGDLTLDVTIE